VGTTYHIQPSGLTPSPYLLLCFFGECLATATKLKKKKKKKKKKLTLSSILDCENPPFDNRTCIMYISMILSVLDYSMFGLLDDRHVCFFEILAAAKV
jgi:hypothetical protein